MRGLRRLACAFLVLATVLGLCLATLMTCLASAGVGAPRLAAVAAVGGSLLAGLGLFMTWGAPGDPLRNAARTLAVLLGLLSAIIALLLWAASTSGGGE